MSRQTTSVFFLPTLLLLSTIAAAADDAPDNTAAENARELQRLAGRYERTVRNEAGTEFRVVKEVAGDQSTVTTYDDVGQVVTAHTSTFSVAERAGLRVLTFRNLKVTAGTDKGREHPAPQSYLYRLEGEVFAETWGLLPEDKSPPRMIYWRKVK